MANLSSDSLKEYKNSIKKCKSLIKLEKKYTDPPKKKDILLVEGLRGAIIISLVASFETYIKNLINEHMTMLKQSSANYEKLPEKIKINNTFNTLKPSMEGIVYQSSQQKPKTDRIKDIYNSCNLIIKNEINPLAFIYDIGIPNPSNIDSCFKAININDIFQTSKDTFDKMWKNQTHASFIKDQLQAIINCRNSIAHEAESLKISRNDIIIYYKFMLVFGSVLDKKIRKHIKSLIQKST